MYDVALPGLEPEVFECPLCLKRPVRRYAFSASGHWQRILKDGPTATIHDYLVEDRKYFQHGLYEGRSCPVQILPGPALDGLSGVDARSKASDLMKILGLI
jgi:hypothetical protein